MASFTGLDVLTVDGDQNIKSVFVFGPDLKAHNQFLTQKMFYDHQKGANFFLSIYIYKFSISRGVELH